MSIATKCTCGGIFTYCIGGEFCLNTRKDGSDSSVIIHPVKQRMYTRDEVYKICREALFDNPIRDDQLLLKWFDKNYPK
jgi:hypothetical protein